MTAEDDSNEAAIPFASETNEEYALFDIVPPAETNDSLLAEYAKTRSAKSKNTAIEKNIFLKLC